MSIVEHIQTQANVNTSVPNIQQYTHTKIYANKKDSQSLV